MIIKKCKCGGSLSYKIDTTPDPMRHDTVYIRVCIDCNLIYSKITEEQLRAECWRDFYNKQVISDSV